MTMASLEFAIPAVRELCVSTPMVSATLRADALHDFVVSRPDLLCVPIGDQGRLYGLVYSRQFIKEMSQQYVRELARRKTARDFAVHGYLGVQSDDLVTDVLAELLRHDPQLKSDSIPVFQGDKFAGIVPISGLMLSLSDTQKKLIDHLGVMSRRLQEEIDVTATLQRNLMPTAALNTEGCRVAGMLTTSTEVGGDFYDYFPVGERHVVLAIGDASGHGVPAGMLVAAAKATLHTLPPDVLLRPGKALEHLNMAMLSTGLSERLMTFFYAVVDVEMREVVYANAAQNFPYLWDQQRNRWESLDDASGMPLGLDADSTYATSSRLLQPGNKLFMYTDGLVEELDPESQEEYGYDRLVAVLRECASLEPSTILTQVENSLVGYTRRSQWEDDVTMVCMSFEMELEQRSDDFAVLLLKSAPESTRCDAEKWLRAHGYQVVDGLDVDNDSQAHATPLYTQNFFDSMVNNLVEHAADESPVLFAERPARLQINNLRASGINRVLFRKDGLLLDLGMDTLIRGNDRQIFLQMGHFCPDWTEMAFGHTEEKELAIATVIGYLEEQGLDEQRPDLPGAVMLLIDEMLENAFLAAPEEERMRRGLSKGALRALWGQEQVSMAYGGHERFVAVQVRDNWGRFDPAKMLYYFARNAYGGGVEAGVGGAGLYLMWRFADYLHIHVTPGQHTVVTVVFAREGSIDPDVDKSFQLTVAQG